MGGIAALLVAIGVISSAFASPTVVAIMVLIAVIATAIDAIWVGHVPIWFAIVAGVALQVGYVVGVVGRAAITRLRRDR